MSIVSPAHRPTVPGYTVLPQDAVLPRATTGASGPSQTNRTVLRSKHYRMSLCELRDAYRAETVRPPLCDPQEPSQSMRPRGSSRMHLPFASQSRVCPRPLSSLVLSGSCPRLSSTIQSHSQAPLSRVGALSLPRDASSARPDPPYGLGEDARKSRLLKTRVKPTLFAVEFAFRLMLAIWSGPAVPAVVPGLAAWKTKSVGWTTCTV